MINISLKAGDRLEKTIINSLVGPVCANIIRKIELRLEMLDINVLGYNDVPEKVE